MDSVSFNGGNLSAKLVPSGVLKGSMSVSEYCHDYDGSYTAAPANEEQIFETKDKRMADNFTVQPIPVDLISARSNLDAIIDRTITEISNNGVTGIGPYAFSNCQSLTTANFPLATGIGNAAFSNCPSLTTANFPLARVIGLYAFADCSSLTTLILRKSDAICILSSITAFTSTPIASGTGYIYVPSALVEDYKAATSWGVYADQIRAIEDYPEITEGGA